MNGLPSSGTATESPRNFAALRLRVRIEGTQSREDAKENCKVGSIWPHPSLTLIKTDCYRTRSFSFRFILSLSTE